MCRYIQHLESRIANLERLLREVCHCPPDIHTYHQITPHQFSSRGDTGDYLLPTHDHPLANPRAPEEHRTLGPLPASAYSNPEDMDPLSLLAEETSDDDVEFFSETTLEAISQAHNGENTSSFYGKSSLLVFTNMAFDERGEPPPSNINHVHAYRKEFWITPDVSQ